MTANTQTVGIESRAPMPAVGDDAIADEIRVVQSVQNQHYMPLLLLGSAISVAVVLYIDWAAAVSSHAVYLLLAELFLLLPMLRSYLKLRGRPRPERVSTRRIRTIQIYSLLMGLVWAIAIILMMSQLNRVDGVVLIMVMSFLSFGGAVLAPSLPKASTVYFVPIILATFFGAYLNEFLSVDLLIILFVASTLTIARTVRSNWQNVTVTVRLSLENLRVETEQSEMLETVSNQLAKYLSPQLYQSIFRGEQKVEIASKRKKLTVFFSDIADFTETTDQLESEELTELLNRYLTEMSKIAHEHGATIDKFIGDAMMLYFGDPETKGAKEDAAACIRMSIAMQQRMRDLQTEWRELGLERTFELRIGINTGYCTVGNFGSEDRMDYTIIGSEVNLAARLQSQADVGGILLANETHSLVKDWLLAEQGETITVKGLPRPIMTFRVKGIYDELAAEGRIIHRDQNGLTLTIDHNRMSRVDKAEAIHALKDALAQLEG